MSEFMPGATVKVNFAYGKCKYARVEEVIFDIDSKKYKLKYINGADPGYVFDSEISNDPPTMRYGTPVFTATDLIPESMLEKAVLDKYDKVIVNVPDYFNDKPGTIVGSEYILGLPEQSVYKVQFPSPDGITNASPIFIKRDYLKYVPEQRKFKIGDEVYVRYANKYDRDFGVVVGYEKSMDSYCVITINSDGCINYHAFYADELEKVDQVNQEMIDAIKRLKMDSKLLFS